MNKEEGDAENGVVDCGSTPVLVVGGHVHEPGCGHHIVRHEDHYDVLNDNGELQHLIEAPTCCSHHEKADEPVYVSHGKYVDFTTGYVRILPRALRMQVLVECEEGVVMY